MSSKRIIVLIGALALVAAACGGSTSADTTTTTTVTTTTVASGDGATTTTVAASDQPGDVAAVGDTVSVDYVGTLDSGEMFDSSEGRDPLTFTLGSQEVIPGFENAVIGMKIGESKTVRIPVEEAYGEPSEELILDFPIDQAPEGLVVGDQVQLGNGLPATVVAVTADTVTVDANHPLAGEALTFEITLVSIG